MIKKAFFFNNEEGDILYVLRELTAFISPHCVEILGSSKLSNIKNIVVETLTNSIKHSGVKYCTLSCEITNDCINIVKTETGAPFIHSGILRWPLSDNLLSERVLLYKNNMQQLFVEAISSNSLAFFADDSDISDQPLELEAFRNFGLLIIARCSDSFTYTYDELTGMNTFSMRVDL